ncbi:MAG: sugar phosphate isomerase/epimerase family protein [Candidatus Bathyarchaeia archaeon]
MFLSIRDFTVKWVGYDTVFDGLKDLGIPSFELFVSRELKVESYLDMGYVTELGFDVSSKESRESLKRKLREAELSVCAILVENDFSSEDLDREVDYVLSAVKVASELEVDVVRINAVMRPIPGYDLEKHVKRVADAVGRCIGSCRDLGVSLAVENHGVIANKREFLRSLFQMVNDEHLGLTLDTGNFYWFGYPLKEVYEIIEEFASKVKHTHVKNAVVEPNRREVFREPGDVRMAPLYQGDIDLGRVVKMLKNAGYDYDLTIEDESLGMFKDKERLAVLKKDVAFVGKLL